MSPDGEARAEEVSVGAAVCIHRCSSSRVEKRQLGVVIAAKIRHESYRSLEVEGDGGASTIQVGHAVAGFRRRSAPEGISQEPFDFGSVVFRFASFVLRIGRLSISEGIE